MNPPLKDTGKLIDELYAVIVSRRDADPAESYTARKFAKGTEHIAKKVGEEAVETAIAAVKGSRPEIVAESADLLFHLMVLWADAGVRPVEVFEELKRRRGVSGLEAKAGLAAAGRGPREG